MLKVSSFLKVLLVLAVFSSLTIWAANAQKVTDTPEREKSSNTLNFHLENVERITSVGKYKNTTWSPNSTSVAFTSDNGTFIFSLTLRKLIKLTNEVAGFKFFWTRDGKSIVYRTQINERVMAIKQIEIETGKVSILTESSDLGLPQEIQSGTIQYRERGVSKILRLSKPTDPKVPFVYQQNHHIFVVINDIEKQITIDEGKYFLPQLSPDGLKIVYQEISRGLYVTDLQHGITVYLGKGDDAAWSPDSKYIIYEITVDDGHSIVSSELYIADLHSQKIQLTNTADLLEMRPSWSPDGRYIAFDANGAIYLAEIGQRE